MVSLFLRCLTICLALGLVARTSGLLESELLHETTRHRLEQLKNDLVEELKKAMTSEIKDATPIEAELKNVLIPVESFKVTDLTHEAEEVDKSAAAVSDEDASVASKEPTKVTDLTHEAEEVDKSAAAVSDEDASVASKEPTKVTDLSEAEDKPLTGSNAAADANDDDDVKGMDGAGIIDGIFFFAAGLADEILAECGIDLAAIYKGYSPATLADVNDARTNLLAATQQLSDTLAKAPGFADDLKKFVDSGDYLDSKVPENINKTMGNIEKTISSVHKILFCAEARIIANRLQMTLYGGVGFANGYLCNKVFVELLRLELNATKVLKASTDDKNLIKTFTQNLVEDIECYEKELEFFNQVVPTTPYTAQSHLQTVAFTSDFLIDYGVVVFYHRIVLAIEAEIIKICVSKDEDDDENGVNGRKLDDDAEVLTDQLQKLLKKLNEVSSKKESAEAALRQRTGVGSVMPSRGEKTALRQRTGAGSVMPSRGEKTALKESYYKRRID